MSYSALKHAVNSTLGTEMFQPLDELVTQGFSAVEQQSTFAFFGGDTSYKKQSEEFTSTSSNEYIFCNSYKHRVGRKVYAFAGTYVITLDLDTMKFQKLANFKIVASATGNLKNISKNQSEMGSYHIGNDIYLILGTRDPRLHKYSVDNNTLTEDVFFLPSIPTAAVSGSAKDIRALIITNDLRYVYLCRREDANNSSYELYRVDLTTNTVSKYSSTKKLICEKIVLSSNNKPVSLDNDAFVEYTYTNNTTIGQKRYPLGFEAFDFFEIKTDVYAILGFKDKEIKMGLYDLKSGRFIATSTKGEIVNATSTSIGTWLLGFSKDLNLVMTEGRALNQYAFGLNESAKLYLTQKDSVFGDGKLLSLDSIIDLKPGENHVSQDGVYYYIDGSYLRVF